MNKIDNEVQQAYVFHDFQKVWKYFPVRRSIKEMVKNLIFSLFPFFFSRWIIYHNWKNARIFRNRKLKYWHPDFWERRIYIHYPLKINTSEDMPHSYSREIKLAVVVHAFYTDIFLEIFNELMQENKTSFSLYLTGPEDVLAEIESVIPEKSIPIQYFPVKNHGRDILPFLQILPKVFADGNHQVLKLHTKRSNHLNLREHWRNDLLSKLIGEGKITRAMEIFSSCSSIGMIGPAGNILPMGLYYASNGLIVKEIANKMGVSDNLLADLNFIADVLCQKRSLAPGIKS